MSKGEKKTHVSDDTFAELMKSAEQAFAYERGERTGYRVTQVSSEHPRRISREGTSLRSTLIVRQVRKKLPDK